ncbi:hypothetical protein BJX76DRAFT_362417 [Aspergillus varians]
MLRGVDGQNGLTEILQALPQHGARPAPPHTADPTIFRPPRRAHRALARSKARPRGRGQVAVVRVVLARGADRDAWDLWEKTPLVYAARNGHLETGRVLLEHDMKLARAGPEGLTSLEVVLREFKKLDPPVW